MGRSRILKYAETQSLIQQNVSIYFPFSIYFINYPIPNLVKRQKFISRVCPEALWPRGRGWNGSASPLSGLHIVTVCCLLCVYIPPSLTPRDVHNSDHSLADQGGTICGIFRIIRLPGMQQFILNCYMKGLLHLPDPRAIARIRWSGSWLHHGPTMEDVGYWQSYPYLISMFQYPAIIQPTGDSLDWRNVEVTVHYYSSLCQAAQLTLAKVGCCMVQSRFLTPNRNRLWAFRLHQGD